MFRQLLVIMFLGLALSLPAQAAQDVFGPIKRTDTLWRIAEQLNPDKKASTQQVMLAIYKKNQHAFTVNNINSLRKDAYMLAPTVAEVNALNRKSAIRMVQRHNTRWKKGRYVAIHNPVPAELRQKLAKFTGSAEKAASADNSKKMVGARTGTVAGSAPAAMAVPETIVEGMPLKDQLRVVMQELSKAQQENQLLKAELKEAREQQQQNLAKNQPDPDIQTQLDALRRELAELRTILAQKDNHIQTLQASLKSASEAIKSQHADNMRLYNKLKELSPESVSAQVQNQPDKPQIKLAAVTHDALLPEGRETAAEGQPATAQVWADETETSGTNNAVSLSQLASNSVVGLAQSGTAISSSAESRSYKVSPVAWTAVLLSFVFILFLVIRALVMQNEIRKFSDEK